MRFVGLWKEVSDGAFFSDTLFLIVFAVGAAVLLLSAVLGLVLKSTGIFAALFALVGGVSWLTLSFCGRETFVLIRCAALLSTAGGGLYLILWGTLTARKKFAERKAARAEIERKLQYTLPQRENAFVRARLNTVLQVPKNGENAEEVLGQTNAEELCRLSHAQKLLLKVKAAKLTTADRLSTEELTAVFGAYLKKEKLTAGDLRLLNDAFSDLLKLSAKYSV